MFQALARLDGKAGNLSYFAYLVGVYHQINLEGFGGAYTLPAAAQGKKTITGNAVELGGKVTYAMVSLAGQYYMGKATSNMLGSMVVFGDIDDVGYWASLAGNITKEFSLTVTYGANTPDKADMRLWGGNSVRLANTMVGGMVKYQDGGYALAIEGYQLDTKYSTSATTDTSSKALQVIGTVGYFF
jgi:hypothetical protein